MDTTNQNSENNKPEPEDHSVPEENQSAPVRGEGQDEGFQRVSKSDLAPPDDLAPTDDLTGSIEPEPEDKPESEGEEGLPDFEEDDDLLANVSFSDDVDEEANDENFNPFAHSPTKFEDDEEIPIPDTDMEFDLKDDVDADDLPSEPVEDLDDEEVSVPENPDVIDFESVTQPEPEKEIEGVPATITNRHVEGWIGEGNIDLLLRAYPLIDHFSIRNKAVKLLGEYAKSHHIDPLIILASIETEQAAHRQILKLIAEIGLDKVSPNLQISTMGRDQQKNLLIALGELKIQKLFPQIKNCINDSDANIRALAISASAQYGKLAEELIPVYGEKLRMDRSLKVQLSCARAFLALGTQDARNAFEKAVDGAEVDEKIINVLDQVREKVSFGGTRKRAEIKSKEGLYSEKGGMMAGFDFAQMIKLIIVGAIFLGAMVWMYKQWRHYNPTYRGDIKSETYYASIQNKMNLKSAGGETGPDHIFRMVSVPLDRLS